jgi:hypothetical protein
MPRIEGYRFGHVVIDGDEQKRDVIVLPDRVLMDWWRADGHRLVLRQRGVEVGAAGGRGRPPLRRARPTPHGTALHLTC